MKKFIVLFLLLTLIINFNFSSEISKSINDLKSNDYSFKFNDYNPLKVKIDNLEKYSLSARSSKNLVELGKVLTFTGIGTFALSAVTIAAGFATGISALYLSGAITSLQALLNGTINWGSFLSSLNSSLSVMALSTATVCLWVIGALAFLMSAMLIPGIILWAIGSSKSKKAVSMLDDGMGFAVKL